MQRSASSSTAPVRSSFVYAAAGQPLAQAGSPHAAQQHVPDPGAGDAGIQPQRGALDGQGIEPKEREQLRALGFTAAAATPTGGILIGTSSVVLLDEMDL